MYLINLIYILISSKNLAPHPTLLSLSWPLSLFFLQIAVTKRRVVQPTSACRPTSGHFAENCTWHIQKSYFTCSYSLPVIPFFIWSSRVQSNEPPATEGQHYCVDENTERRNHYLDLAGIENYTSRFEGEVKVKVHRKYIFIWAE